MARPRKPPSKTVVRRDEPDPLPWEKQRGEGQKAFHAFSIYRDLGPTRSLAKVMEILGETGAAGPTMVEPWSSKWRWVERVDAWDRDQDRRATAERDRAIADARRTQAMAGTLLLGAALRRTRGDREGGVEALDLNELDAADVARLADVGAKLQRAGLGDSALDLKGAVFISGPAFQDFARSFLVLALERVEAIALAVVDLNGDAGPAEVSRLVVRHQDALVEDGEALFRRTTRS